MREIENPFAVLGVEVDASMDAINNAWKEKVKKLHPDRYPDAPEEIVSKLNEETSRVNVAYQLLKDDPERMRAMFAPSSSESHSQGQQRSSKSGNPSRSQTKVPRDACEVCASLNTETFTFTRQTGFVFARNVGTMSARLCKGCATAMGRTYQARTLATGWWGVISVPTNLFYIIKNSYQLFRAGRLADPVAPPGFRTTPLPLGKPVLFRPIAWVGIAILALVAFLGISNYEETAEWKVGNCVSGDSSLVPVPCSSSNSGKIIEVTTNEILCPASYDGYVEIGGMIYCIDSY